MPPSTPGQEKLAKMGYMPKLEIAIEACKKMHRRGIACSRRDYGFAWTPHGTYAKDLESSSPSWLLADGSADRRDPPGRPDLRKPNELGQVKGYLADLILVDGDP